MKAKNKKNQPTSSSSCLFNNTEIKTANDIQIHDPAKLALENAYYTWCRSISLAKGNGSLVADLYSDDAILVPTFSPQILFKNNGEIENYFSRLTSFVNLRCQTELLITKIAASLAFNTGLYSFSYLDNEGQEQIVPARFTFIYKQINHDWQIMSQHSSTLPKLP